jgi:hypothetical protein
MGLFLPIGRQQAPCECVPVFPCGISLWFAIAGGWYGNLLLRLRLFEVSHLALSFSVIGPVPIASHALPVRCLNCDERTFTSVSQFLRLRRMRKARHREHQQRSTTS